MKRGEDGTRPDDGGDWLIECRYFFPDNTHKHVVYAGDTANLEDAIYRLEGYSLLH